MKLDNTVTKDAAFIVIVLVLFVSLIAFVGLSYIGFKEAEHPKLFELLYKGFSEAFISVITILGARNLMNGTGKENV